jgi:PAS domain S-box-containing protein
LAEGVVAGLANHTALLARDGAERSIEDSAAPIRDDAGRLVGTVMVFRDVTQARLAEAARSRLEQQLRESEHKAVNDRNRLEAVMETLPVGVAILDEHGGNLQSNSMFDQIWGGPRPPIRAVADYSAFKAWWADSGALVLPEEWASARAVHKGETVVGQVMRIERFDGKMAFILNSAAPVLDAQGLVAGCAVGILDITDRMEAEAALRASEELYETLAETAPALVWLSGADGQLAYVNSRWLEYTGLTLAQFNAQGWAALHHPDDQPQFSAAWERAIQNSQPFQAQLRYRRHDGAYRWFLCRCAPIKGASAANRRWAGISSDITEMEEARAVLARSRDELENLVARRTAKLQETVQELERFSYSISHDMRAPLRAMQGFARALIEDYGEKLDAEGRDYLDRIIRASLRQDRLIQDVLTYSRIVRQNVQVQQVDLGQLVEDVIQQYPNLHPDCIELEVAAPLEAVIGHDVLLTQCLSNLLSNAAKFVAAGVKPRVRLWTERIGADVRLWVEDNGIGIAPEHQERIFGFFERLHGQHEYEGTGIGLAVVRKAVERMGGRVGVISQPGRGSRFWIQLLAAVHLQAE